MLIVDSLYGEFYIDGVLEELINSKPVQRLKGIHQGGASYLVKKEWNVTRYEHSIGVMLLVKKIGGSLEEQIAGLLHDVSHTAFSHVVDFVLENKDEDYHEKIYSRIINGSSIPTILAKYGYNLKDILFNDSRWSLLEQSAPDLCADRVDYTLRDLYTYGNISMEEVQHFLQNLIVKDGKMVLPNIEIAEWFTSVYYEEVIDFFMNPLNLYGNYQLAFVLKAALDKQIITLEDFLLEDNQLLQLVVCSQDDEIQHALQKLHPSVEVIDELTNYDFHQKMKVRLIDPLVCSENGLVRASDCSKQIQKLNQTALQRAVKGTYVKILSC
ncbi:HD domain-containing protein [Psychrobacillus sp. Sa2BUA9]|uniref:HD domain-containing protein n=1 Tax=Psychrobacillus faecigallinarum TaxID=2762235 RepID=A0ABR8R9D8_9BACI|nr:HD domain-containing protein [Psychrobacillus faecigallinarum]MBD7944408.1 HD domain-containing protein [Psychrobacillus faecigallinarum]